MEVQTSIKWLVYLLKIPSTTFKIINIATKANTPKIPETIKELCVFPPEERFNFV